MSDTYNGPDAKQALQNLLEGNKRYIDSSLTHPHQDSVRRQSLSGGQQPFAIVLTCSDSRVPPEIIFDQGLGDLFVIRVAGNIVDDIALGSIEYAAAHLHTPLLMVMGHTKCGAVTATVSGVGVEGHIANIVNKIKPVVNETRNKQGDPVTNAVFALANSVADQLTSSEPVLADLVQSGRLQVVPSVYDVDSGKVEIVS